jgi:hypothetical protein
MISSFCILLPALHWTRTSWRRIDVVCENGLVTLSEPKDVAAAGHMVELLQPARWWSPSMGRVTGRLAWCEDKQLEIWKLRANS